MFICGFFIVYAVIFLLFEWWSARQAKKWMEERGGRSARISDELWEEVTTSTDQPNIPPYMWWD